MSNSEMREAGWIWGHGWRIERTAPQGFDVVGGNDRVKNRETACWAAPDKMLNLWWDRFI